LSLEEVVLFTTESKHSFADTERTNGNTRKGLLFSMFSRIGLCAGLKIFVSGEWDCWILV
jgi:hypothetical protein